MRYYCIFIFFLRFFGAICVQCAVNYCNIKIVFHLHNNTGFCAHDCVCERGFLARDMDSSDLVLFSLLALLFFVVGSTATTLVQVTEFGMLGAVMIICIAQRCSSGHGCYTL